MFGENVELQTKHAVSHKGAPTYVYNNYIRHTDQGMQLKQTEDQSLSLDSSTALEF